MAVKESKVTYLLVESEDGSEDFIPALCTSTVNLLAGLEREANGDERLVFINNGKIVRGLWE